MGDYPYVVVAPWPTVRRFDGEDGDGVKEWRLVRLDEAIEKVYETDAMMVAYRPVEEGVDRMPLLKGVALKTIPVLLDVLVYDVDPEKGEDVASFKSRVRGVLEALAFDEGIGWWETWRGYRVIVWLDTPLGVQDYKEVWQGWADWLFQHSIVVDDRAADLTRVMRLPQVHRQDQKANVVLRGEWYLPEERKGWLRGTPKGNGGGAPPALGLRPLAAKKLYAGKDRNDGLFRIACSMRRLGLTDQAMLAALKQVDLDICNPPLQVTDPGEIEGLPETSQFGKVLILCHRMDNRPFAQPGLHTLKQIGKSAAIDNLILIRIKITIRHGKINLFKRLGSGTRDDQLNSGELSGKRCRF